MFQLPGTGELIVIIAIFVLLFGGSRAISSMKDIGEEIGRLRKDVDDLRDETYREVKNIGGNEKR